jgi:hypothetical protein
MVGPISPLLFFMEHVVLDYKETACGYNWDPHPPKEIGDRTQWRELLKLFNNAKILFVRDRLATEISRSLQSDDGQLPLGVLPNLQKLRYFGGSDARDADAPFIDERQVVGHPVKLTKDYFLD